MRRAWAFIVGFGISGAFLVPPLTHAQQVTEIYRCVDADGRRHYTNAKKETAGMKCELVTSQINVAPAAKPSARAPTGFPRETARESASARERQHAILQKELVAEEQALTKARQALADQEAVRSGDERNYARVQERLQPYKDSVETHQKNIEALKRELANLYR